MLASIKKWVNMHYGMLADSAGTVAKFMVVYAILLALNASPANKCQHKFQPGILYYFLMSSKVNRIKTN